jgi:hypothetical protein
MRGSFGDKACDGNRMGAGVTTHRPWRAEEAMDDRGVKANQHRDVEIDLRAYAVDKRLRRKQSRAEVRRETGTKIPRWFILRFWTMLSVAEGAVDLVQCLCSNRDVCGVSCGSY